MNNLQFSSDEAYRKECYSEKFCYFAELEELFSEKCVFWSQMHFRFSIFFFFLVGEENRMFCFYLNIRKSCAVCLPTWPYLVSWCEWCLQKWAHKALARNTCPALFSFGHWSVAWLCRNQVLSTPDKSLLLRSIPDYLNLFLRIFPQCPGVLSLLPWFIQS